MRTQTLTLFITFIFLIAAFAQPPQDAFDRALAHVGLTKATARFDEADMNNFGGGEFRLPFFRALHGDPYKVPNYTQAVSAQLSANAKSLATLISYGSARVDELTRRGLIDNPLEEAEKKAAESDALTKAVAFVCEKSGKPLNADGQRRLRQGAASVPASVAKPAALLLYSSVQAYDWRQRAFAEAAKRHDLSKLFSRVPADMDREFFDADLFDLMHAVDLKALFAGAQDLAMAVDRAIPELGKLESNDKFAFRWETPLGLIEIVGADNNTYDAGIRRLLTIDTGGNDTYASGGATLSADNPISVLIDLRGNDQYAIRNTQYASFGAGVFGYGVLVDAAGNDTYNGVGFSQGSGAFGVGCLLDLGGGDRYISRLHSQGAAQFGIGVLSDIEGHDRYEGFLGIQGFGYTKGFGLLLDLAGNDEYVANDAQIDFPSAQTKEHNTSLAQGCGFGRRADYSDGHSLAGGIGILLDADGDDKYSAGVFAQGTGYWYGLGMLLDEKGDDSYSGIWYVQAASAHFAVGILVDGAGSDRYKATMNMAQGAGHDFSLGFLLDKSGNDQHEAPNLSLGGGNANGIGIFYDVTGDDTYQSSGTTLGRANYESAGLRAIMLCLGVFLDTGGKDTYPANVSHSANNKVWTQPPPESAPLTVMLKGVGVDVE